MEHAELVAPRVAHDPEVKAALLLMGLTGHGEGFKALTPVLASVAAGARTAAAGGRPQGRP